MFGEGMNSWYTKQLNALEELSLYKQKIEEEKKIFRFTWLRTFHNPISIRLEILQNGSGVLYSKMTDGAGGYEPGKIRENTIAKINKKEVEAFLELINMYDFWNIPTQEKILGCDGAMWIIEGVWDPKYHLVERWSPKKGSIRAIGLFLLRLSGLDVKNIY